MNFAFTPEQDAWRAEVKKFLRDNPRQNFHIESADDGFGYGGWSREFGLLLASKGWVSLTWPKRFGGTERPWMDVLILFEELAYAWVPWLSVNMAWSMANTIIAKGSDALKNEFLPGIASGQSTFWLAMSEPDAGSDLLSLKTVACEEGEHYVVNGQKVWSSMAHLADYGELFVKTETDAKIPRHKCISVLIMDKRLPGVSVRPMLNLMKEPYHTEVFMDNVRIPKHCLLGEKNKGFYQMLEALEFDRFWARFPKAPFCRGVMEDLVSFARETRRSGRPIAEDPAVRNSLAESNIEIEVCSEMFWAAGRMINAGVPLTHEASVGKVFADEMGQRFFKRGVETMGPGAARGEAPRWAPVRKRIQDWYLFSFGHTLAGGTSEINRNVIATGGLGLPRA